MCRRIALSLLVGAAASCAATGQFGVNLVVNGSFEDYVVEPGGRMLVPFEDGYVSATPAGWTISAGQLYADAYHGPFAPASPVPPGAGAHPVYGSFEPISVCEQVIDLGFVGAARGAGQARYSLSAYLGSFFGGSFPEHQDDIARIQLSFHSSANPSRPLQVDELVGPNNPSDVGYPDAPPFVTENFAGLVSREGLIPEGADWVSVTVALVRDTSAISTAFNNANADLIEFIVHAPCPGDVNGDGNVDFADLNVVVSAFNTVCP